MQSKWRSASIPDDQVRSTNSRGTVVFATAGPNSRTTQLFINTRDQGNAFLDNQGFSPIGRVIEGAFLFCIAAQYFFNFLHHSQFVSSICFLLFKAWMLSIKCMLDMVKVHLQDRGQTRVSFKLVGIYI